MQNKHQFIFILVSQPPWSGGGWPVIRSSFLSVSNLLRLSLCLFSVEARAYKRGCVRGESSVVQTSHLCLPESSVSPIHLLGCSMPGAVLEPTNGNWILLVLTIISFLFFRFILLFFYYWFYLFIVLSSVLSSLSFRKNIEVSVFLSLLFLF